MTSKYFKELDDIGYTMVYNITNISDEKLLTLEQSCSC